MTYYFHCDGKSNCANTNIDEEYCDGEILVCNKEEHVNNT